MLDDELDNLSSLEHESCDQALDDLSDADNPEFDDALDDLSLATTPPGVFNDDVESLADGHGEIVAPATPDEYALVPYGAAAYGDGLNHAMPLAIREGPSSMQVLWESLVCPSNDDIEAGLQTRIASFLAAEHVTIQSSESMAAKMDIDRRQL